MAKAKNPFLKKAAAVSKSAPRPAKKHGLGRGLDSLMPAANSRQSTGGGVGVQSPTSPYEGAADAGKPDPGGKQDEVPFELPILDIARSPWQPRRDFSEAELAELAESLKNNGLVQPPTVRKNKDGRYELIAGERRLRAALLAGWKKIRVTLIEADDLTAAAMTTTENLQREDLNPIEEAISYKSLQENFGLTQQEVADRVGKGRATVANSVRLLELPDEVKALVQNGLLSTGHAKLILSVDGEKDRVLLARECVNGALSVRALEKRVAKMSSPQPVPPPPLSDIPSGYAKTLEDALRRRLGCAVRLTSSAKSASGRRIKGHLEIDFFDNSDLDRIVRMIGVELD
ncbi:MAG: ParB/RepB/Spo0J family partition protein [Kiritimatiellae bacterium]|nr:ParB/RepB/Spo0J family partition protein [Kiritimatiellia bacterium]